jgi:hypothetical protein
MWSASSSRVNFSGALGSPRLPAPEEDGDEDDGEEQQAGALLLLSASLPRRLSPSPLVTESEQPAVLLLLSADYAAPTSQWRARALPCGA